MNIDKIKYLVRSCAILTARPHYAIERVAAAASIVNIILLFT